jgi:phage shock protein PspC (stress-responsive transcriptional regulator)
VLGGVCAGIARSAGLDPLLLRIVLVAATVLTGGAGIPAYLAAWVLIPREADEAGLPSGADPPDVAEPAEQAAGPDVRAAWTAVGHDLRALGAELRRPTGAPVTGAPASGTTTPRSAAAGPATATETPAHDAGVPPAAATPPGGAAAGGAATDGAATDGAATDGAATDGAATDGAATESDLPDGAVPPPRSPQPAPEPLGGGDASERGLLGEADDAATALGERLRDPEVQAGARRAAASVSQALSASADELGRRIRREPS